MEKYSIPALRERAIRVAGDMDIDVGSVINNGCYENIFRKLKKQDSERVAEGLRRFYGRNNGESEEYFPNGDELGEYINRVMKINWFRPRRKYCTEELQGDVDEIAKRFKIEKSLKARTTYDLDVDWDATWDAARIAVRIATENATWDAARIAAGNAPWNVTWNNPWNTPWNVTWNATLGATGDVAGDVARDAARGATYVI